MSGDDAEVEAWLGAGGHLAQAVPGYEPREAQLAMARAVAKALRTDGTLLVEAGTGTGKTLAYLLPALLSGKKVVISTGTKTLQDQIVQRDLPLLQTLWPETIAAACMKGLQNYLCLRRYEEFRRSAASVSGDAGRSLPLIEQFRGTTLTGDRAELTELALDAGIWQEVSSSSETRVGGKCRHYEACFVTKMRRAAEAARLIIVNHHLFFADLALRGPHNGAVLPDYDAVIFDEAHMIEDVATDFFGVSVSTTKLEQLLRDAQRTFAAEGLSVRGERPLGAVSLTAARFFDTLPRPRAGESGRVPLPPEAFSAQSQEAMFALDNALDGLSLFAQSEQDDSEAIAQIARRAEQIRDQVALIAEGGPGDHVTWTLARGRSVSLGASPVEVGSVLAEKLFFHGGATVLTSATLSAAGSFDYIKTRWGVTDAEELCVDSPFDYAAQAALYLPRGLGDPRGADFLARAVDEVVGLVELTQGGAFVLCTSLRVMQQLAARARPRLRHKVMVQGEAPNAGLLDAFRRDGNAVLFATAGFWQGVDVPGDALRLVIIDKLPFEVPSDPLVSARCVRLKERGQEPFMKYLVPSAALTLKQGFGRLIRTRKDRGIVALLDERVSSKGYGKVFLRSLPAARRCSTLAELQAFWRGDVAEPVSTASAAGTLGVTGG
ncbi:MAG: ATP-dependent DNA helicase [Polyangiales bacterium]